MPLGFRHFKSRNPQRRNFDLLYLLIEYKKKDAEASPYNIEKMLFSPTH